MTRATPKTAIVAALVLCGILIFVWRPPATSKLGGENTRDTSESHQEEQAELQRLRAENLELERYRSQATEVHGLRNQVAKLTRENEELANELRRTRKELSDPGAFTQKQIVETGEKWDIAISGAGFFEVQMADGRSGYTRDGRFKIAENGRIETDGGLIVLSGIQPVPKDTTDVSISPNGEVQMTGPGGTTTYRIQLTRFSNPEQLKAVGNNRYRETTGSGPPETGNPGENDFGELAQGYLENFAAK